MRKIITKYCVDPELYSKNAIFGPNLAHLLNFWSLAYFFSKKFPEVYHDIGYQMLFISQLVSFQMIFLTQNPLVSGWTNERDQCSLSVCFENQIDIHKV